jgi:hypothetical protein
VRFHTPANLQSVRPIGREGVKGVQHVLARDPIFSLVAGNLPRFGVAGCTPYPGLGAVYTEIVMLKSMSTYDSYRADWGLRRLQVLYE